MVPVVAEFAVTATTEAPVKIPVLVTLKAVAEVDEDVISPKATTAEPPIVVAAGKVTVAPVPKVISLLVLIPANLTTGIKSSIKFPFNIFLI